MQPLTDEQFDAIIEDALDDEPGELMAMLDNVVFLVEAEPPPTTPTCSASTKEPPSPNVAAGGTRAHCRTGSPSSAAR